MRAIFKAIALSLAATVCLCAASSAQQAGRIESMKLLTPDTGWAATNTHLFWTVDNGRDWKDITPKTKSSQSLSSVFFLDSSRGWVLLAGGSDSGGEPTLDLASTDTAGASWLISRVKVPKLNPESTTLSGDSRVDFVDSVHGWICLGVASSSNFRLGILLVTNDGGKTWDWPPQGPGVFGRIRFVNPKNGWLAGGPGDEKLYATHDGSSSWQEVSLQAPPQAGKAVYPTFDQPPSFTADGRGFLSVTYSGPDGTRSVLALFTSADEGRSWTADRVMLSEKGTSTGQTFPSVMADSVWITASVSGPAPELTEVSPGGVERSPKMDVSVPDSAFLQLSFQSGGQGWVLSNTRLLSTMDAGRNWKDVTPAGAARQAGWILRKGESLWE